MGKKLLKWPYSNAKMLLEFSWISSKEKQVFCIAPIESNGDGA